MSDGMSALLLVAASALAGTLYYLYLKAEPFPADVVRLGPLAWLLGSVLGGVRAARALKSDSNRPAGGLALALSVPSAVLAVIFSVAALIGD